MAVENPPRPLVHVIVNARSGSDEKKAEVAHLPELFTAAGADSVIWRVESGGAIASQTRKALTEGAHTIVAGGGDGTIAEFDPINPYVIYMGTQFAVHRHTTGGSKNFDSGWRFNLFDPSKVAAGETTGFVPVFTLDGVEPSTLYGGSDKALYRSTNYGEKFNRVDTTEALEGPLTSISVSTVNHNRVWVGTATGKIYRYDFDGNSAVMTNVSSGLPARYAAQVMAGADSADVVYAVFSGYDANTPSTPGKVFMSTDAGATWRNISANLPDVPASAIALDPVDVNRLWVAQDLAIYSTRDRGATWTSERRNMPIVAITDIDYNRNTGYLIAATHGRGVWRIPVDGKAASQ